MYPIPSPTRFLPVLVLALAAMGLLAAAGAPANVGAPAGADAPAGTQAGNPTTEDRDRLPSALWTRGDDPSVIEDDVPPGIAFSPFLLTRTDATAVVMGPVAHTIVRQEWENPNRDPVDGLYIFPLPDNAAVTAMRLSIGSRVVEAEMRRREEARAVYEQARAEGRVAGLLDQERPNVFAQRVANLMPGARIAVSIEFDQEVRCDDGTCAYILPTVVGPRFVPERMGDPGAISPPIVGQGRSTGQALTFRIDLDAGMPIRDLRSPSHRMAIANARSGRASATLADEGGVRLDRDVEVRWDLGGRDPEFGVLAWRDGGSEPDGAAPEDAWRAPGLRDANEPGVFAAYLMPPVGADEDAIAQPRELTFVLDCSGSMRGTPLDAARNVVRLALRSARPEDSIQLLRFSERASGLFPAPAPATDANVRRALAYLDTLQGEGGTEMLSGIRAALGQPADPERLRIVAFLTDGYIGNETAILDEVRRRIGDARLFSFGIGSSVNRYLLANLAAEGRGTAAFIGPRESPDDLVRRFVDRIATPVFTDLRLSWEGIDVEDLEPAAVPDLFAGQPLVVHGRYSRPGTGTLIVEGRLRGRRVALRREVTLPAAAADHAALGRLWARARIDRLTRETYGRPHPDTVAAVTGLGLRFRLMTPYTSLVAVDSAVSNPVGVAARIGVPVEMPEGVSYEGIFGSGVAAAAVAPAPVQGNAVAMMAHRAQVAARESGALAEPDSPMATAPPMASVPPAKAMPPPPPRLESPYDSARRDGGRADKVDGARQEGDEARRAAPALPATGFLRIVLTEEDGTQRIVEEDGEAWVVDGTRRRLARTLTAEALEQLRAAILAAGVGRWPAGDATWARGRSRLVVVLAGGLTRNAALPAGDPPVAALAALVRAAAF